MADVQNQEKASIHIGRYGRGNIDLDNRPVYRNSDGSISTERSFSINDGDKEVLLPAIIGGKPVSQEEAVRHYMRTGEHLGKFDTVEEANEYAEALHLRQARHYGRKKQSGSATMADNLKQHPVQGMPQSVLPEGYKPSDAQAEDEYQDPGYLGRLANFITREDPLFGALLGTDESKRMDRELHEKRDFARRARLLSQEMSERKNRMSAATEDSTIAATNSHNLTQIAKDNEYNNTAGYRERMRVLAEDAAKTDLQGKRQAVQDKEYASHLAHVAEANAKLEQSQKNFHESLIRGAIAGLNDEESKKEIMASPLLRKAAVFSAFAQHLPEGLAQLSNNGPMVDALLQYANKMDFQASLDDKNNLVLTDMKTGERFDLSPKGMGEATKKMQAMIQDEVERISTMDSKAGAGGVERPARQNVEAELGMSGEEGSRISHSISKYYQKNKPQEWDIYRVLSSCQALTEMSPGNPEYQTLFTNTSGLLKKMGMTVVVDEDNGITIDNPTGALGLLKHYDNVDAFVADLSRLDQVTPELRKQKEKLELAREYESKVKTAKLTRMFADAANAQLQVSKTEAEINKINAQTDSIVNGRGAGGGGLNGRGGGSNGAGGGTQQVIKPKPPSMIQAEQGDVAKTWSPKLIKFYQERMGAINEKGLALGFVVLDADGNPQLNAKALQQAIMDERGRSKIMDWYKESKAAMIEIEKEAKAQGQKFNPDIPIARAMEQVKEAANARGDYVKAIRREQFYRSRGVRRENLSRALLDLEKSNIRFTVPLIPEMRENRKIASIPFFVDRLKNERDRDKWPTIYKDFLNMVKHQYGQKGVDKLYGDPAFMKFTREIQMLRTARDDYDMNKRN